MADQKRWFKVWCSLAMDPSFLAMPLDTLGRWVLLGAWVAQHGNSGVLVAPEESIRHALRMRDGDVTLMLQMMPHVNAEFRDGEFTVTFLNWQKYQEDSTHAERQRRYRDKVRDGDKKRREERRVLPPIVPHQGDGDAARSTGQIPRVAAPARRRAACSPTPPDGFTAFWSAYPRRVAKQAAVKAWAHLAPGQDLRDRILQALAVQVERDYRHREPDKIPHPATWLNGRRWEDEPPMAAKGALDPYATYPRLGG